MDARELRDDLSPHRNASWTIIGDEDRATILRALDLLAAVEGSQDDLVRRLNGVYTIPVTDGGGPLNGKREFTRTFDVPPIQREAAAALVAMKADNDRMRERLEIVTATDGEGNRIPFDPSWPDGIEARDETIRQQDKQIAELKAAKEKAEAERDEIKRHAEFNANTRATVDYLLAQAGFAPDSSVRNLLACMNFDSAAHPKDAPEPESKLARAVRLARGGEAPPPQFNSGHCAAKEGASGTNSETVAAMALDTINERTP